LNQNSNFNCNLNPFSNGIIPFDKVITETRMDCTLSVMGTTVFSARDEQSPGDILTGNYTAVLLGFSRGSGHKVNSRSSNSFFIPFFLSCNEETSISRGGD
jgi:hypothetical protein